HQAEHRGQRVGWYLAGWACLVLACFSKVSALVFPGVLLLLKWTLWRVEPPAEALRESPFRRLLRPIIEVIPHLLVAVLFYRWYRGVITDYGVLTSATAFEGRELLQVLFLVDPLVWLRYVAMVLTPGELSAQYLWDGMAAAEQWPQRILAVAVILAVVALAIALVRKRPRAGFLFLSFSVLLLPYSNVIFLGWWNANRYVYGAAPFLVATILLFAWPYARSRAGQAVAAAVAVIAAWNLIAQQQFLPAWRDGESLWRHEVELSQATLRTHNNLISSYVSMALRAPPEERGPLVERGKAAARRALERYRDTDDAEMDPGPTGLVLTYYALGLLQSLAGDDTDQQLETFRQAYDINPAHAGVNDALGALYLQMALDEGTGEERTELARQALFHFGRALSQDVSDAARERRVALRQRLERSFPGLRQQELIDHLGPTGDND
ncbi:MAG: hypothetical protein R3200_16035, partial [Xanthomonadales bacterium]|nr:hypothetical protein [Xanthomonadales bacterium]